MSAARDAVGQPQRDVVRLDVVVNGETVKIDVDPRESLLEVPQLRDHVDAVDSAVGPEGPPTRTTGLLRPAGGAGG